MAFTREQIASMRETQLQKDVLIPLFKAMEFRGVTLYHGGSLELGKDIVMWKEGELRERVNFGVVVKADKVSGKATGKGSANEVYFQIMQCFNEPYADLTSTEEQKIHRCWVVSSGEITKEAVNAIKGQLANTNLDKVTDFIGGDRLWDLIQQFMPEQGVVEHLESAQKKLDDLIQSSHYRVTATTKNEFIIEPKYPGAERDYPLTITTRFKFDTNEPEGKKALAEWERHLKTGAPVTIKSQHLAELNFPEFLRPLINPAAEGMQLVLGTRRSGKKAPFKFELLSHDGEVAALEYVELEVIQEGTEEVTLSNEQQSSPWKVTFVLNVKKRRFQFSLSLRKADLNVKQALQGFRFYYAMMKAGEVRIENLENGISVIEPYTPPETARGLDKRWLKLLEELVFIQAKTSILLTVPTGDVSVEDAQIVLATAHILRTGHATFTAKHWPVHASVEQAKEAFETFGETPSQRLTLDMKENQKIVLFGVDIPLGRAVMTCDRAHISKRELAKLKKKISASSPGDEIQYQLSLDSPLDAKYLDWLPQEEVSELMRLPFLSQGAKDTEAP